MNVLEETLQRASEAKKGVKRTFKSPGRARVFQQALLNYKRETEKRLASQGIESPYANLTTHREGAVLYITKLEPGRIEEL